MLLLVLVAPLTALSHDKQEVLAAVLGISVSASLLAVPLAWKGRTLGQALIGLQVVRSDGQPVSLARAYVRSLAVAIEVAAAPTVIFALPAVLELVSLATRGYTVTDQLLATAVVSDRRSVDATIWYPAGVGPGPTPPDDGP